MSELTVMDGTSAPSNIEGMTCCWAEKGLQFQIQVYRDILGGIAYKCP